MTTTSSDALNSLSFIPLCPAINPNIFIYTPAATAGVQVTHGAPRVIVLATWLGGATTARVAVYCRAYKQLYPATPILLIRTTFADICVKSFSARQDALVPARDHLLPMFSPNGSELRQNGQRGILLHIFSHGGCNTALQFSRLLRNNHLKQVMPLPILGVILDCCPGSDGFFKAYKAAAYSVPPSQPMNFLGRTLLVPFVASITTLMSLGVLNNVGLLRQELNDMNTFGPAPRLYLHSNGDHVVASQDVVSHAGELAEKGVEMQREVWEWAMHCALPTEDSKRYWTAIRDFVSRQCQARSAKL